MHVKSLEGTWHVISTQSRLAVVGALLPSGMNSKGPSAVNISQGDDAGQSVSAPASPSNFL